MKIPMNKKRKLFSPIFNFFREKLDSIVLDCEVVFHVNTIQFILIQSYFMANKAAWVEAAKNELKHTNPLEQLQKQWSDWFIDPYYDASDGIQTQAIGKVSLPHKSANDWLNIPTVNTRLDGFNSLIANHLNKGADGVMLQVDHTSRADKVLESIKPEYCFLGFESAHNSFSFFEKLEPLLRPIEKINGCIFWKEAPVWQQVARLFSGHNNFRCFGIHVGTLDATNLERAFYNAIQALDELTDNTFNAPSVLSKFAFSVTGTSNFFLDVAMIRSLKIVFERLAMAYGVTGVPAFVRYITPTTTLPAYDPHGVMISGSLNSLSAAIASVDAITVEVENANSALHIHTARSVALVLKEESKLDKVIDPLAGSYFVESLTNTIVDKIWTNLKNS